MIGSSPSLFFRRCNASSFLHHVSDVVGLRAKEEMRWSGTWGIIADMQDRFAGWNTPEGQGPCNPVYSFFLVPVFKVQIEGSVIKCTMSTRPDPAPVIAEDWIEDRPEQLINRDSACAGHSDSPWVSRMMWLGTNSGAARGPKVPVCVPIPVEIGSRTA